MDIQSAYEVAKKLRNLAREADKFEYSHKALLMSIIEIAQNYEEIAERFEMEMIIALQRDWVETN